MNHHTIRKKKKKLNDQLAPSEEEEEEEEEEEKIHTAELNWWLLTETETEPLTWRVCVRLDIACLLARMQQQSSLRKPCRRLLSR